MSHVLRVEWRIASDPGQGHEVNQDSAWHSADGRLCVVADGGTRRGQRAEIASATCVRVARETYRAERGDDLIERIVGAVNSELLGRVARDEPIGSTTVAAVHFSASGRTLGAILGDGAILRLRAGTSPLLVRPLRKFDYYLTGTDEIRAADAIYSRLPWWMRVSLNSALPWASQGIVPTLVDLDPVAGDTLVVCTDGVSDVLSIEEIAAAATSEGTSTIPDQLVRRARAAGGRDDATCAVTRLPA